tara:strand:- start:29 stop:424 length:396 start_codon:yes stop_codon:yes gene_type:complete
LIGLIATLVKPLVGGVVNYVQTGQEIKKAEKENRARLLRDTQSNNHDWEMANLTDKDKWLRRISFAMFSAPFVWALFDPLAVEMYFTLALSSMPEWYIQLYAGMIGGVWGIAALKNTAPALVAGIVKAVKK